MTQKAIAVDRKFHSNLVFRSEAEKNASRRAQSRLFFCVFHPKTLSTLTMCDQDCDTNLDRPSFQIETVSFNKAPLRIDRSRVHWRAKQKDIHSLSKDSKDSLENLKIIKKTNHSLLLQILLF